MNKKLIPVLLVMIFLGVYLNSCGVFEGIGNLDSSNPILDKVKQNFSLLDESYSKIPLKEGTSSYTENKSIITLCLKDPETGKYYDFNTIMYVALHELTHMVTKTLDVEEHGPEFMKNFEIIKSRAAKKGIYDPNRSISSTYCGINKS